MAPDIAALLALPERQRESALQEAALTLLERIAPKLR